MFSQQTSFALIKFVIMLFETHSCSALSLFLSCFIYRKSSLNEKKVFLCSVFFYDLLMLRQVLKLCSILLWNINELHFIADCWLVYDYRIYAIRAKLVCGLKAPPKQQAVKSSERVGGVKISMERRKWDHKSLKVNLCDIFIYNHHRSSFDMLLLLWLVFAEISSLLIAPKQQPTHILNVTLISTWADFDRLQLSLPLYLDRRRDRFRSCLSFSVTKKNTEYEYDDDTPPPLPRVQTFFSTSNRKKTHFALLYISVWSFAQ